MGWWTRGVRAAASATNRARDAAERRWAATNAEIAHGFATRTVTACWNVGLRHGQRVTDSTGRSLYSLRAGDVHATRGRLICSIQRSNTIGHAGGERALVVRHSPYAPLIARLSAATSEPITVVLLPLGLGQGSDAPYREQAWAASTRSRGPLIYRSTVIDDGEVEGRLIDVTNATLVRDRRRYLRSDDPARAAKLREWSLELVDNFLPDPWLLGILQGTVLLADPPATNRTSL